MCGEHHFLCRLRMFLGIVPDMTRECELLFRLWGFEMMVSSMCSCGLGE